MPTIRVKKSGGGHKPSPPPIVKPKQQVAGGHFPVIKPITSPKKD